MKISLLINKTKILSVSKLLAVFCFIAFVVVGGDISVDMPNEWVESLNHDMALMRENPEFMMKYTLSQIIHQTSSTPNPITASRWVDESVILTVSAFLWASLVCCLFQPKGLCFRTNNIKQHIGFSCALAGISLFQIVNSVQVGSYEGASHLSSGDLFFWVPWLLIVIAILGIRIFNRLQQNATDYWEELILLVPFFVGLILISLSWTPIISPMRAGASIELPLIRIFVNSYTIILNLCMVPCCVAMFWLQKRLLEKTFNFCDD